MKKQQDHVEVGWNADHTARWIEVGLLRIEEDDSGATVLARTVVPDLSLRGDMIELYGPTKLSDTELAGLARHLVGWFSLDLVDKLLEIEERATRIKVALEAWNDRARLDEEHPPYDDLTRSLDELLARCRELRVVPAFRPHEEARPR